MALGASTVDWGDPTELALNHDLNVLNDFRLASAPVDRFVRTPVQVSLQTPLHGAISTAPAAQAGAGAAREIPLPFFWYDPPWALASLDRCRLVADVAGRLGLTISALESDLTSEAGGLADIGWPRLAPHRCDRAGWSLSDAQQATVIELRLGMNRDAAGHYRYSAAQMDRWYAEEATGQNSNQDRSWIPLLFPPEWPDLSHLSSKLTQLRRLGQAAIYVSCDESDLAVVLPVVSAARGDGVIVRCAGDPTATLQQTAAWFRESAERHRPRIWLAGCKLTAEEAVKCIALGAAAIAIDWMCDPWLLNNDHEHLTAAQRTAINLGVNVGKSPEERLTARIQQTLENWRSEVGGIVQSLLVPRVHDLGPQHLRLAQK